MFRMSIPMFRVVPINRTRERPVKRIRPSEDSGERIVEAYFAVLTIVILGMIIGIFAYAVLYVIPDWQRPHSPRSQKNFPIIEFRSNSSEGR
jgi:hypothetical protein